MNRRMNIVCRRSSSFPNFIRLQQLLRDFTDIDIVSSVTRIEGKTGSRLQSGRRVVLLLFDVTVIDTGAFNILSNDFTIKEKKKQDRYFIKKKTLCPFSLPESGSSRDWNLSRLQTISNIIDE
jgi:hypothetical protein